VKQLNARTYLISVKNKNEKVIDNGKCVKAAVKA